MSKRKTDEKHRRQEKAELASEVPERPEEEAEGPGTDADLDEFERIARERDEYLNLLQRARAEFSNFRKRIDRERMQLATMAVGEFVKALLPVVDDLDRALEAVEKDHDPEAFVRGIHLVRDKLNGVLDEAGVSVVDAEGQPFDPVYHEAVMVENHDELKPGTVSEVLLKGYLIKENTLRPAQVKVVKGPTEVPEETAPPQEADDEEVQEES